MVSDVPMCHFSVVEFSEVGEKYLQQCQTFFWLHFRAKAMNELTEAQLPIRQFVEFAEISVDVIAGRTRKGLKESACQVFVLLLDVAEDLVFAKCDFRSLVCCIRSSCECAKVPTSQKCKVTDIIFFYGSEFFIDPIRMGKERIALNLIVLKRKGRRLELRPFEKIREFRYIVCGVNKVISDSLELFFVSTAGREFEKVIKSNHSRAFIVGNAGIRSAAAKNNSVVNPSRLRTFLERALHFG